jgi:hypothetical protein
MLCHMAALRLVLPGHPRPSYRFFYVVPITSYWLCPLQTYCVRQMTASYRRGCPMSQSFFRYSNPQSIRKKGLIFQINNQGSPPLSYPWNLLEPCTAISTSPRLVPLPSMPPPGGFEYLPKLGIARLPFQLLTRLVCGGHQNWWITDTPIDDGKRNLLSSDQRR